MAVSGNSPAPVDANGWPLADAKTVLFDVRPLQTDAAVIDDPQRFQPDWSGTYRLSFHGQADVYAPEPGTAVFNKKYDAATNTTTAEVTVHPGQGVLTLAFLNTRRTPDVSTNTGITKLCDSARIPGRTTQPFTSEYLKALAPFSVLRFAAFTAANQNTPNFTDADNVIRWADRHVPSDATQQPVGKKKGVAWEYVIQLTNLTGNDIWINVPVAADLNYITQLATLLRDTLRPNINIYVEHGDEVWNSAFPQYAYVRQAAAAEVASGASNLNTGSTHADQLVRRYHAQKLIRISEVFRSVFGAGSINQRIRVTFAWSAETPEQYADTLDWVKNTYGPPNRFFYAIAQSHLATARSAAADAPVSGILDALRADTAQVASYTRTFQQISTIYGLTHLAYCGGPDTGSGNAANAGNRILANRDPGIAELLEQSMEDFFAVGGDLYVYSAITGAYGRERSWGATEDSANLNTPKLRAIEALNGRVPPPSISAVVNSATNAGPITGGSFVTIYGNNFMPEGQADWTAAIPAWTTALPMTLNNVFVRVNGIDCFVSYASRTQINVLVPSEVAAGGPVDIEVTAGLQTTTARVETARRSPGLFAIAVGGKQYAAALFAGTSTRVLPENAFTSVMSRPAKPGDYLEIYANGLGAAQEPCPVGQTLSRIYPLLASGEASVTIGGVPALVQAVNMTYPGLFQVNIQVPDGIPAGDLPVVLTVGSERTQSTVMLPFAR